MHLLPTDWTGWSIGFIRRVVGRAAGSSTAAMASISAPAVGRISSLFHIRCARFVDGHFQIRVEMIMRAEFVFREIHTLAGPIPGPVIQEKKRQSLRCGRLFKNLNMDAGSLWASLWDNSWRAAVKNSSDNVTQKRLFLYRC